MQKTEELSLNDFDVFYSGFKFTIFFVCFCFNDCRLKMNETEALRLKQARASFNSDEIIADLKGIQLLKNVKIIGLKKWISTPAVLFSFINQIFFLTFIFPHLGSS